MPGVYRTKSFREWEARLGLGDQRKMKDLSDTKERPEMMTSEVIDVDSYTRLVDIIAFLSVMNKNLILLFRGQQRDWEPRPSLFRAHWTPPGDQIPASLDGSNRAYYWTILREVGEVLYPVLERHGLPRWRHLQRHQPARWAVIQHYELWPTPLLDFSTSLRISASFAFGLDPKRPVGYLFVVGVKSVCSDLMKFKGTELAIRLNSVCPPSAVRPHLQDGVLVGHYFRGESFSGIPAKGSSAAVPIAAFRLTNDQGNFWSSQDFPMHTSGSLLPPIEKDALLRDFRNAIIYDRDPLGRITMLRTLSNFRERSPQAARLRQRNPFTRRTRLFGSRSRLHRTGPHLPEMTPSVRKSGITRHLLRIYSE